MKDLYTPMKRTDLLLTKRYMTPTLGESLDDWERRVALYFPSATQRNLKLPKEVAMRLLKISRTKYYEAKRHGVFPKFNRDDFGTLLDASRDPQKYIKQALYEQSLMDANLNPKTPSGIRYVPSYINTPRPVPPMTKGGLIRFFNAFSKVEGERLPGRAALSLALEDAMTGKRPEEPNIVFIYSHPGLKQDLMYALPYSQCVLKKPQEMNDALNHAFQLPGVDAVDSQVPRIFWRRIMEDDFLEVPPLKEALFYTYGPLPVFWGS